MKYAWIEQQRSKYSVERLCALVSVSRSGYMSWSRRRGQPSTARHLADATLLEAIRTAHEKGRGNYGPKKVAEELKAQGLAAGINRIKRLRKRHDIICKRAHRWKATTNSKHALPVAPNLLDQRFDRRGTQSRVGS